MVENVSCTDMSLNTHVNIVHLVIVIMIFSFKSILRIISESIITGDVIIVIIVENDFFVRKPICKIFERA